MAPREPSRSSRPASRRHRTSEEVRHHRRRRASAQTSSRQRAALSTEGSEEAPSSSRTLTVDTLARLNEQNVNWTEEDDVVERRRKRRGSARVDGGKIRNRSWDRSRDRDRDRNRDRNRDRDREYRTRKAQRSEYREVDGYEYEKPRNHGRIKKRRVVSGAIAEEGRSRGLKMLKGLRGGDGSSHDNFEKESYYAAAAKNKKKRLWSILGCAVVIVIVVVVVVAVVVSKKNSGSGGNGNGRGSSSSSGGVSPSSIPAGAPSWLDPFQWVDTTDFNLTYTDAMVGGLPVMGLNSTWDNSNAANDQVPALNQPWGSYASKPARGVNLGGWLSIEPFITPSLFNYDANLGIIDEWTLSTYLGPNVNKTLEDHYSTFVTEQTFQEIADAGLDHVRIPYSYWAVVVYPGDPYLFRTSWRYLLRGIEWARKYGLRVNLDLHGLPGSQNGWNHSGRQGPIGWFNGTDGDLNAQRSLAVHEQLMQFFAQDRYRNIIMYYGLANEPRMTFLSVPDVINWTETGYAMARKAGLESIIVFGDGFMGLNKWEGLMPGYTNMTLDAHQYVIFNENQIDFNHTAKIQYACAGWTEQTEESLNTATGYGPTIVAEWSQADTDCAQYLTNVGWGNRWEGTYNTGNVSTDVLTPRCPLLDNMCECEDANAAASAWSAPYKSFLLAFAEAQMYSFEKSWGWWYWTWDTESAPQWSYKQALAAGIVPQKAYQRSFNCDLSNIPSFSGLPEYY